MRQEKAFLPGDYVFFGTETRMGEPREWVVLMTNTEERTALIATTKSVAEIPYHNRHNEYAGRDQTQPLAWRHSFVRKWLNNHFLDKYTDKERKAVQLIVQPKDREDEEMVMDEVFILSEGEASLFFENDESRVLLLGNDRFGFEREWRSTCRWWLRDQATLNPETGHMEVPVCAETGELGGTENIDDEIHLGVRACMWVKTYALREACDPDLEELDIRLMEKSRDTVTLFRDGSEQVMNVLAEFADYETKQVFAVLQDKWMSRPVLARMRVDLCLRQELENRFAPLMKALKNRPYHHTMDVIRHRRDMDEVADWMKQDEWAPTPGYWQPEIDDSGKCLIRLGRDIWDDEYDDHRIYWRVIKRKSNKILCVCEKGIVLTSFMKDTYYPSARIDEDVCWELSEIRRELNEFDFGIEFTEEEEKRLMHCQMEEEDFFTPILYDRFFLLSAAEVSVFMPTEQERIISGVPSEETREYGGPCTAYEAGKHWWWLRTRGRRAECICCVSPEGRIDRDGQWGRGQECAVRPAILVELTSEELPCIRKE